jgi:hypothetical protein
MSLRSYSSSSFNRSITSSARRRKAMDEELVAAEQREREAEERAAAAARAQRMAAAELVAARAAKEAAVRLLRPKWRQRRLLPCAREQQVRSTASGCVERRTEAEADVDATATSICGTAQTSVRASREGMWTPSGSRTMREASTLYAGPTRTS